jgi:hypothetical protein
VEVGRVGERNRQASRLDVVEGRLSWVYEVLEVE